MERSEMTLYDQVRDEVMQMYASGGNDDYRSDMASIILIDKLLTDMESAHNQAMEEIENLKKAYENIKKGYEEYKAGLRDREFVTWLEESIAKCE